MRSGAAPLCRQHACWGRRHAAVSPLWCPGEPVKNRGQNPGTAARPSQHTDGVIAERCGHHVTEAAAAAVTDYHCGEILSGDYRPSVGLPPLWRQWWANCQTAVTLMAVCLSACQAETCLRLTFTYKFTHLICLNRGGVHSPGLQRFCLRMRATLLGSFLRGNIGGSRDVRKNESFHLTEEIRWIYASVFHTAKNMLVWCLAGRRSAGLENILQQTFVPRTMSWAEKRGEGCGKQRDESGGESIPLVLGAVCVQEEAEAVKWCGPTADPDPPVWVNIGLSHLPRERQSRICASTSSQTQAALLLILICTTRRREIWIKPTHE